MGKPTVAAAKITKKYRAVRRAKRVAKKAKKAKKAKQALKKAVKKAVASQMAHKMPGDTSGTFTFAEMSEMRAKSFAKKQVVHYYHTDQKLKGSEPPRDKADFAEKNAKKKVVLHYTVSSHANGKLKRSKADLAKEYE